jgi:hypothetical protein
MCVNLIYCPFDDCRSKDIVECEGGVRSLAVTQYKTRNFDGNETHILYRCNKCGESFWLAYFIEINNQIKAVDIQQEQKFLNPLLKNNVGMDDKKNGRHLP